MTVGRSACVIVTFPGHTDNSLTFSCVLAQSKSKGPHCKYHQQGSVVSYQNKCVTKVVLLKPGPNPFEHICDEIVKNYVIICVCIVYVQFYRC